MAAPLVVATAYGINLKSTKDGLLISSENHAAAVEAGRDPNLADEQHLSLLAFNDFAAYLKFERLVALINQFADADPNAQAEIQIAAQILAQLDEAILTGKFGKGAEELTGKLTFKDKKTNGLKQLANLIQAIEAAGGE